LLQGNTKNAFMQLGLLCGQLSVPMSWWNARARRCGFYKGFHDRSKGFGKGLYICICLILYKKIRKLLGDLCM
jgi:hypothetical protein